MTTNSKVLSNMIWRFLERVGAQLVQFVVSIVLARILVPEDYGIIALVTVFISVMNVFVDSGLGTALVQKKDADNIDFSTVFYTNVVFCVLLYFLLFITAPFIARFYNNDELTKIIRVLSLTVVISGVKNIQQAFVSKTLQFKKFFFSTLIGTIAASVVGIILAIKGFGVWALVAQQLTNLATDTLILCITVKWRPDFIFSFKRLKDLFSFGWKLLISSLLETVYSNLRNLIIGKKYSSEDLAFYSKGAGLPDLIVGNINNAIDSVLFPVMAEEQDDKSRVKAMTRRAIKTSTYCIAPFLMGLAGCAPVVIHIIYTDKWLPCVPYLRIFCFANMFFPIHSANLNAIKAVGRSDLFLKLEIIKKVVGMIILLATMNFGVIVMAYSVLLWSFICQIINAWPNKKLLNYSYFEQIKDILPGILIAIIMGILISFFNYLNWNVWIILVLQISTGVVFFVVVSYLFKLESFFYLKKMITEKIGLKK